jgi:DNA-binding transcriptional regulator YiaG
MSDILSFHCQKVDEEKEPILYRACGVDGIYLYDGYEVVDEGPYGKSLIVHDADTLHKVIGLEIVLSRPHLSYRDVVFLRGQMDKSQVQLANEIGVSVQMVARYEKEEQTDITGPADRLLRAVYVAHLFPEQQAKIMGKIIGLYQEGEDDVPNLVFSRAQMHWVKIGGAIEAA